jgi:hypothetical protein
MRFGAIALVCLVGGGVFALVRSGKEEAPKTASPQTASVPGPVAAARPATAQEVALVPDGTPFVSPESGKTVLKNASTPALVHEGRLYFLCCDVCMQKCQAAPSLLQGVKAPNGYDLRKLAGSGS